MKIGIIGNMNNAYFSLCRYLRDAGYDCHLLIYKNEPDHFDPSCDTISSDYQHYVKKVKWGEPADFLSESFAEVENDVRDFDFLIGNGPAPAYMTRIGRQLDVFVPYGYDLYALPFIRLVHPLRFAAYAIIARYQRTGIRNSSYIFFDRTNKEFEKIFDKLGYKGNRIISCLPMIYHKEYEQLSNEHLPIAGIDAAKLRRETDLLIVQHARQIWKHLPDRWSHKGNDELIKGYAKFLELNNGIQSRLVLFEYGTDVDETKQLIEQLGISASVVWLKKMPRKELMKILALADLVIGELHHSWLTYGVILEALCLGKPVMHHRRDEEYIHDYPELYPMLNANSASTVLDGLTKIVADRNEIISDGLKGKEWFRKFCVNRPVETIVQLIKEKQAIRYV
jgi:glycosyltransferase involved in cell wall biosynthesis